VSTGPYDSPIRFSFPLGVLFSALPDIHRIGTRLISLPDPSKSRRFFTAVGSLSQQSDYSHCLSTVLLGQVPSVGE
jgi:hypothetical protein